MSEGELVLRAARAADWARRAALVRGSIAEYDLDAFLLFLFQEASWQAGVLGGAVLFIFFGCGAVTCLSLGPALAALLALGVALAHRAQGQRHARRLRHELAGLVAECAGRLVGTVSLSEGWGPDRSAWLHDLAVDKRWRRRGVGRALAGAGGAAAAQLGRQRLDALVSDVHVAARALLHSMRWRVVDAGARPVLGVLRLPLARLALDLESPPVDDRIPGPSLGAAT